MKIGKYIVGLISGLTFGMLFAPKKGKDLRKELVKHGKKSNSDGFKVLGDAFKEAGQDVAKEFKNLTEHEQVSAFLELSQDKMKSFLDAAEEKGYDVAATVQEKLEEFSILAKRKAKDLKGEVKTVKKSLKATKKRAKSKVKKVKKVIKKVKTAAEKEVEKVTAKKPVKRRKKRATSKKSAKKATPKKA